MRRFEWVILVFLSSLVALWNSPAPPEPEPLSPQKSLFSFSVSDLPGALRTPVGIVTGPFEILRATEEPPQPIRRPKLAILVPPGPEPTQLTEVTRRDIPFSIRGLSLGLSLAEIESLHGPGILEERTLSRDREGRWDRFYLAYGQFSAFLDQEHLAGEAGGNGLERYGVPILAAGDTSSDVEELLGYPNHTYVPKYTRGQVQAWLYHYESFTLEVRFFEGRIQSFSLRAKDFQIATC